MANPLFKQLGGSRAADPMGNFLQQFPEFMRQMKGKDPNKMISELVSSGKINQDQLNQVQQRARQMSGMFEQFKGMLR